MANKIEIPINGTFILNGVKYKVIKNNYLSCEHCDLGNRLRILSCNNNDRSDNEDVCFKRINELENKKDNKKSCLDDIVEFLTSKGFSTDRCGQWGQMLSKHFNNDIRIINVIEYGIVNQQIEYSLNDISHKLKNCIMNINDSNWKEKLILATKENLKKVLDMQANAEIEDFIINKK